MTQAKELLALIESVEPSDTAKLDEIDANTEAFLLGTGACFRDGYWWTYTDRSDNPDFYCPKQYTRSRDALKAIRPKGWSIDLTVTSCALDSMFEMNQMDDDGNPTHMVYFEGESEELAELHCIIQAIDFERSR